MEKMKFEIKSNFKLGEKVIYKGQKTRIIGFRKEDDDKTYPIVKLKSGWIVYRYLKKENELYIKGLKDETRGWHVLEEELEKVKK